MTQSMFLMMMLSSFDAQVDLVSSEIRQLKNLFFITLVHFRLLSAFASRVDFSAMSAHCLLAYHHPYGLMAICQKSPFIRKVLYRPVGKDKWWRF